MKSTVIIHHTVDYIEYPGLKEVIYKDLNKLRREVVNEVCQEINKRLGSIGTVLPSQIHNALYGK